MKDKINHITSDHSQYFTYLSFISSFYYVEIARAWGLIKSVKHEIILKNANDIYNEPMTSD